ncbi:MAG: SpoIIE family protein phosphatase [Spirochaetales bacterium]|nr:SpoIIE family protein phosphatase [Spirochaetales bacterium]
MNGEQETAASIQLKMLPETLPNITGYNVDAVLRISEKAGGDFYDIVPLDDDHIFFMIGDTSGKEMTAVLYMNSTISIVYALMYKLRQNKGSFSSFSLIHILEILNNILRIKTGRGHFVTIFIAVLNTKTHQFTYATSGHNPVILYNPETTRYKELKTNGQLCGIVKTELYKKTLEEKTEYIEPGDYLIFYTNGITEAHNRGKELYKKQFYDNIEHIQSNMSAGDAVSFLLKGVEDFTRGSPPYDDITLICLKRNKKEWIMK